MKQRFSHSIALFGDDSFWENNEYEKYAKEYEFNPDIEIDGCTIYVKELSFPEEWCGIHFKERSLFIVKKNNGKTLVWEYSVPVIIK